MSETIEELPLSARAEGVLSAREAAEAIYEFALKHGLVSAGGDAAPAELDDEDQDDAANAVRATRCEQHIVIEAFKRRPIKLITYDNKNRVVTIFTDKPLGVRIKKQLPLGIEGQVNIQYMASGTPEVRGSDTSSFSAEPYYVVGGRYACGSSIFPANRMGAGTLGLLVKNDAGELFGLTNNHVTGACNHSEAGLPILAPATGDVVAGRIDPFTIGRHHTLRPIHDGHPGMITIDDNLDVATFSILNPNLVSSMQGHFYDTPGSVLPLDEGMRVEKVGRTTGRTTGAVIGASVAPIAVLYDVREYGIKKHVFFPGERVFTVKADNDSFFSTSGDSGALVVYTDDAGNKHSVGLVFAGNEKNKLSFIAPLHVILEQLGVSVVSGHGVP